jgi:uncharacterized protein DUF1573
MSPEDSQGEDGSMTHSKKETRELMANWRGMILVALAVASGCSRATEGALPPAELQAEPGVIDLGDLDWGMEVEESLRLSNPGETAIHIKAINTSCGCARVLNLPEIIGPASEVPLRLKFRMQLPPGVWRSPLTIEHSGSNSPLRVKMQARIRRAWRFSDHHDALPEVEPGATHAGVLRLESTLGRAPQVTQVRSSSAALTASSPREAGASGIELPYRLLTPMAAGYHRYSIVLFCAPGDPHERIQAPVEVWVRGSVDASPRRLRFPKEVTGDRELIVRGAGGQRLRFLAVTGQGVAVSTREVKEVGPELRLKLSARAPVKPAQLTLQYECDGRPGKIAIGILSRDAE